MNSIKTIKCGNVNCYLVTYEGKSILIDTGTKKYEDKVLDKCKDADLKLIILTHGHIDHVQNAASLSEKLESPIAIHKSDSKLIHDNMEQQLYSNGILGGLLLKASLNTFKNNTIPNFEPQLFIKDGDSIEKYGLKARIIELPGHTKGSIGIDVDNRYLFVGDAIMNMIYPTKSLIYNDYEQMTKSANRITAIGKRIIYFGHGKPINTYKVEKYIKH